MTAPRDILAALDRTSLDTAVSGSRSWRQTLLALGLRSSRHVEDLRLLCEQWAIPNGHLGHQAPPDDQVREVLTTARTWPEALSRLGYASSSGSARAAVRRHALRLGLDVRRLALPPVTEVRPVALRADVRHLRDAGTYLVAGALVLAGHRISWPLESAPYDLVVDMDGQLLRLQVKTTSRQAHGTWECSITRSEYADVAGGKRRVCYQPGDFELFAIVDGEQEIYVIPFAEVAGITNLALRGYESYRIRRLGSPAAGDRGLA